MRDLIGLLRRGSTAGNGGRSPSVAVIGAGFGGITIAVALKRAGIESFTVFEQSEGPGGTWWDNRYPGAEVDIDSHLYSFSFVRYDWTRTHPGQAELLRYLEDVIDRFGVRNHFQFGTRVADAVWDEDTHKYLVHTATGEEFRADLVVSAVGLVSVPKYPDCEGLEEFRGPKFHSARWEPEHDLTGKRVAVVGSGSSASQIVAAIAPVVGRLYVFQREPGWVVPKNDRDFSAEERRFYSSAFGYRKRRLELFLRFERLLFSGRAFRPGTKIHAAREARARAHIDSVFADRPDLKALVTPDYPYGGKRTVVTNGYYEALLRDNVELVPRAVTRATPTGVVDSDGVEREVDILVMATGFQAANFLSTIAVIGRGGRKIHEVWNGVPTALGGVCMPGFPNFYMLAGPNANASHYVFNLERAAAWIVRDIKRMMRRGVTAIEARQDVHDRYNRFVQRRLTKTVGVLLPGSYSRAPSGAIVTQHPFSSTQYGLVLWVLRRVGTFGRRRPETNAVTVESGEQTRAYNTRTPTLPGPASLGRSLEPAGHPLDDPLRPRAP